MHPGAVGAIVAARRINGGYARPPLFYENISDERYEELRRQLKRTVFINKILARYDTNSSGKLERNQVEKLLGDIDSSTPKGTPPKPEEIDFILKVANQDGDDCLSGDELIVALRKWNTYLEKREMMHAKLQEFDISKTGTLEKPELKAYLTSLNGGKPVDDKEVDWVLSEADAFGDGTINAQEMVLATSAWYLHVEEKNNRCCGCCIS